MEAIMHFGTVLHSSSLKVGDVVRPVNGGCVKVENAPALYVPEDQDKPMELRRRIQMTAGWRNAPVGGPDDFRHGYDVMTVYKVTEDYVSFVRPYLHVERDGTLGACGIEHVDNCSRNNGGSWYELLK